MKSLRDGPSDMLLGRCGGSSILGGKMLIPEKIEGYAHQRFAHGGIMRDRVVIKWGGGLITDKSSLCTPNLEVLKQLAETVAECHAEGQEVILVHGAGSYGHLRAKNWRLNEGHIPEMPQPEGSICATQRDAVEQVRREMLELNQHVCTALADAGISSIVHPPHLWATNTGMDFQGDVKRFTLRDDHKIHITFGDVVEVEGEQQFGILSGDDLVVRLALELPHVKRLVFAVGGVDGLLRVPPEFAAEDDLIEKWSPDIEFEGVHQSDIDVTGGIGLKAARGAHVAARGIEVLMVNGGIPERVLAAMLGNPVRGTIVTNKQ